jgi:hypothetical protein
VLTCSLCPLSAHLFSLPVELHETDAAEVLAVLVELPQRAHDLPVLGDEPSPDEVSAHARGVEVRLEVGVVQLRVRVGHVAALRVRQIEPQFSAAPVFLYIIIFSIFITLE